MKTKAHKVLSLMLTLILLIAAVPTAMVSASTATTYKGVDYAPVYDYNYYINKYADLKSAFGSNQKQAFNHFITNGMKEGRQASASFNVEIYKANYADLRNAFGNDLPSYYKHYVQFGIKEGRNAVTSLNGGSSVNNSSSSNKGREWADPVKAPDGSRSIVLKNNWTGKSYTISSAEQYARIRYNKDLSYAYSVEFNNILNNLFGATTSIHIHVYSIKETDGYTVYSCDKCGKTLSYSEYPLTLDTFAKHYYGKAFNQLSGKLSKKGSQKFNVAYKWVSYAYGLTNSFTQEILKKYEGDLQLQINNADKLIGFMNKCNTLANLYGFSYAESLSKILGKASLATALLNPSSTTLDRYIAIVSYASSSVGFLIQTYKTVGECIAAMGVLSAWPVYANDFQITCDDLGITFELPNQNKIGSAPKLTPTYDELFTKGKDGQTKLDKFVNRFLGISGGFKELCEKYKKNTYVTQYKYIMWWLVIPALNKEFAGCTQFMTIEDLLAAVT